jgi:hypothetical protein
MANHVVAMVTHHRVQTFLPKMTRSAMARTKGTTATATRISGVKSSMWISTYTPEFTVNRLASVKLSSDSRTLFTGGQRCR